MPAPTKCQRPKRRRRSAPSCVASRTRLRRSRRRSAELQRGSELRSSRTPSQRRAPGMARKAPPKEPQAPTAELSLKAVLDALLLGIHGVEGGELNGMPAYFVGKR